LLIIQKEFIQVFRNRMMLPLIFVVPIIQLLIIVHAATFEVKDARICVVDHDLSTTSRKLVSTFEASPFFQVLGYSADYKEAEKLIRANKADLILSIQAGFEKQLLRERYGQVHLSINAINQQAAGVIQAYSMMIIRDYNRQLIVDWIGRSTPAQARMIPVEYAYWFNPELSYINFMVPGILVLLVTIIGLLLSAMNIVREKEIGTIEQINVTPIHKYQFIAGKLIPFWILALLELAFGLTLGKFLFDIPMVGSLWIIFMTAAEYLLVVLSYGLFLSTVTNTQQQAMFLAFFSMMIFLLMSGLFTPVESMPAWAQEFNRINPIAYFIRIMRMVLLKGSGVSDILKPFLSLGVMALTTLLLTVWRYRKTV